MPENTTDIGTLKRTRMVQIGVIAAALGGAAFFLLRTDPENEQIDTPESASPYICLDDGHVFELTPAGYQRLGEAGGIKGSSEPGVRGMLMLRCPKCGKLKAVAARRCPKDGTVFAGWSPDGQAPKCPTCGWIPEE
jgi:predicted RNA-binding Zn-ribbon protein involved in translation (DUF1610 family)